MTVATAPLGATTGCIKSTAPDETGLYYTAVAATTFGYTSGYAIR